MRGSVTLAQPIERRGKVRLTGGLHPAVHGNRARILVYGRSASPDSGRRTRHLHRVAMSTLRPGVRSYVIRVALRPGRKWTLRVKYTNPGVITPGLSARRSLIV
jgi:hypothetical protein